MTTHRNSSPRRLSRRQMGAAGIAAVAALTLISALVGYQVPFVSIANASTPGSAHSRTAGSHTPPGASSSRNRRPGGRDTSTTAPPTANPAIPTGGTTPPTAPPNPPAPNPNCTLVVPPAPRTAAGLGTPYQLTATDRRDGDCHEANADQSAFVEATILDPATGALSIYRPLVVDAGTPPAAAPVPPKLPANAVVGVWFGYQGDTLTLRNDGSCVNGTPGSPFGQFGYCGAPDFFTAANAAEKAGKFTVPPLGTAVDGRPCPTTRDFSVVDQDQSDNLTTEYLALPDGRTAQSTPATDALPGTTKLSNASDNGLLVAFVDPTLGCHPFTAPDVTAGGAPSTSLALNELQAARLQGTPIATVPPNDPMSLIGDKPSIEKTDLYRAGADMAPMIPTADTGAAYCRSLAAVAPERLALDKPFTDAVPSPDPAAASTLFGFLVQRLTASWTNLGCQDLIHRGPPTVAGSDTRDHRTTGTDTTDPPADAANGQAGHHRAHG
jgi:hypothetical protein